MSPRRIALAGLVMSGLVAVTLACSTTTAPLSPCVVGGGTCVPTTDTIECAALLPAACSAGYSCCALIDAATGVDALFDAADAADASPPLGEAAVDAIVQDASPTSDAHEAAEESDAGARDGD